MPALSTAPPANADPEIVAAVNAARGGDMEAFGQLYGEFYDRVLRFVCGEVRDFATAEDVTADAFVKAMRGIRGFRWQGREFLTWLLAIARSTVADHFRSNRVRHEAPVAHVPADDAFEEGADERALDRIGAGTAKTAIHAALKRLPEVMREYLEWRFLRYRTVAQACAAIGKTVSVGRMVQYRGLRALRYDPALLAMRGAL